MTLSARMLLSVVTVAIAACGLIQPKPSDIAAANFGPRPSDQEALTLVKAHMSKTLFDPYSAVYACGTPRRAWANVLGHLHYGWVVICEVNAKNRFGGYVGSKPYGFLINQGRITLDAWAKMGYVE